MKSHHLPVTYIVFPDESHGFARPENNIAFFGAAEAFLSAHLGGNYLLADQGWDRGVVDAGQARPRWRRRFVVQTTDARTAS